MSGGWYRYCLTDGVDEGLPGIYEWAVEGAGIYIGKYTGIDRPKLRYGQNVARMLAGLPYHIKSNPTGYRRIHHALKAAHLEGRRITLTILENVSPEKLHAREAELIAQRGELNDPPFGRRLLT